MSPRSIYRIINSLNILLSCRIVLTGVLEPRLTVCSLCHNIIVKVSTNSAHRSVYSFIRSHVLQGVHLWIAAVEHPGKR